MINESHTQGEVSMEYLRTLYVTSIRETEKGFMQAVLELACWNGFLAYHTYNSQRSAPGFPDLVLVRGTEAIFAELKSAAGRVTPAQNIWLDALGRVKTVETALWRPADWLRIEERLQQRSET